jgi:hypothetical protein
MRPVRPYDSFVTSVCHEISIPSLQDNRELRQTSNNDNTNRQD